VGVWDNVKALVGRRSLENPQTPLTEKELLRHVSGGPTLAGATVDQQSALRLAAVFACIRILSETPASLPLLVYKRLPGGGKDRAPEHPCYPVLHDMANPEMTAMTLRETVQAHAVGWGDGYAYIRREHGWVTELWPLLPQRTRAIRKDGELRYMVTLPNGDSAELPAIDVLHIRGLGFDGLRGYSPIALAREAIGLGLAAEEFGARFFGAGTNLGGVVEHPGKLGTEAHKNLKDSLSSSYQGLGKSHLLLILEEGMKFQRFGVPPNEAQFIELRKFQIAEIARLFRIPPHMIADLERSTHGNIEHQAIDFVVHTLRPWLVRWEQEINYKLFTPRERREHFAEHLVDGLLRGDARSRSTALATLRQNGIINADEWRALENMNPQPDDMGKVFLVNGNMVPISYAASKEPSAGPVGERHVVREARAVSSRERIGRSFRPLFQDAAERVVRREKADILRGGVKLLAEPTAAQFENWLSEFYEAAPTWISRTMRPVMRSYAEAIQAEAAYEVNGPAGMTPELEAFVAQYLAAFVARYTGSSAGQLRQLVREALEAGEDAAEAVTLRLEDWEQSRPGRVAVNEVAQEGNAIAREVFVAAGVTRLRWQNVGSKTCAICAEMDGKTVAIHRPFVQDGEVLQAEGQSDMQIYRPALHPPIHHACVCQVVPG